jgi:PKD repeat protein
MRTDRLCFFYLLCAILLAAAVSARAAAPTAAISASPDNGRAPLAVLFDASASSPDATTFLWSFGDGSISTAKGVTHIYTVAGTYTATLTVGNAGGETASSQAAITVTGSTDGPVTGDMNFRWAITNAKFTVKHAAADADTLYLTSTFNTVDLPALLQGLAVSFSINGAYEISGVLGGEGGLLNPERRRKPSYFLQLSTREQTLVVEIKKANLRDALALSGATNSTVPAPGQQTPVTFILTVGAQTYSVTENFTYLSRAGGSGRGDLNLARQRGSVNEGFFAISLASALENEDGSGHFFQFDGYVAQPLGKVLALPTAGALRVKFNDADTQTILFDRLRQRKSVLVYEQSDRDLGGIRRMTIDTVRHKFSIQTWDIRRDAALGGTGLPRRGQPYTAYNFALRLDLDQPDGVMLQAVTATRMTRHTEDDAFWQTGRRRAR